MKHKIPSVCPVCSGAYEITKLTCKNCGSELCGTFSGSELCGLSEADEYFVLTFIKCRGNIKDVEKSLGISYPTVRARLDAVIKKLGLQSSLSEDDIKVERKRIFDMLEKGEITTDQAAEQLKNI